MKTTRYIFAIIALVLAFTAGAKTLNKEQKLLRIDIVKQLEEDGLKPKLDGEGDIDFTKDGVSYHVVFEETWNDPFLFEIYSGFVYDDSNNHTRSIVEPLVSVINQNTKVKMRCNNSGYLFYSTVICNDGSIFKPTYKEIIKQQSLALKELDEIIGAGLIGIDLTGNKETILDRAMKYFQDSDYPTAFKLLRYLADEGYAPSYSLLGFCYQDGLGVSKNEKLMVEYYEKAIENGDNFIGYNLGEYYYNKRKYDKAFDLFKLCSGSENSFRSDAYYMMGKMYEEGQGVTASLSKAIQNYKKSVEYSTELESDGRLALIRLNQQVENPNDFVDISKSLLSGLTPYEMYKKGYEYENGLNNRNVSLPKAYGYYKAAADKNYPQSFAKMGDIYISKFYPFNDKVKSDKYYKKAFNLFNKRSDSDALYQLGMLYKEGHGVDKNQDEAIGYFKKAADRGSADANYELGLIYQEEMETVDAFNYFKQAADKGHAKAMFEVAKAYETGKGTDRDRDKAILWYSKCANTDDRISSEASSALKRLYTVEDEKE